MSSPAAAAAVAPSLAHRPLRLLIVDDSPVARSVLARMLAPHGAFEVAGSAGCGEEALAALAAEPADIVLLDLEMPGISGLQVLRPILATGARVLVVSSSCEEGAQASVAALALGAADTLAKPGAGQAAASFSASLVERLKRIGRIEETQDAAGAAPAFTLRDAAQGPLDCLALGGSTGGLHAITAFLRALPPCFDVPILITQHLPAAFMPFFARQIEAAAGKRAEVAADGLPLVPGSILIAPGDAHLLVKREGGGVVSRLDTGAARGGYCPSVDRMIDAAAEAYGEATMAVLFSGMGRDGLAGARGLTARGGTVLAQDRESSAVWGMPRAVAEAGLASAVLPPAELAALAAARRSS